MKFYKLNKLDKMIVNKAKKSTFCEGTFVCSAVAYVRGAHAGGNLIMEANKIASLLHNESALCSACSPSPALSHSY